jgi:hypothetical protein
MYKKYVLVLWALSFQFLNISTVEKNLGGNIKENVSYSFFTGWIVLKQSKLSTAKVGYENNKLGYLLDLTYDDYKETWLDGSKKQLLRIRGIYCG